MIRRIQHLRGDRAAYLAHDLIVPEGELALLSREDGSYAVKIGDGERPFSALPFLGRNVIRETESDLVTLANETEHRLGLRARLELALPEPLPEDFTSTVLFSAEADGCTVSYPAGRILFIGDHTEGGIFFPEGRHHYVISLSYDGECVLASVRAVSADLVGYIPRSIRETTGYGAVAMQLDFPTDLLDLEIGGQSSTPNSWGEIFGTGNLDYDGVSALVLFANKTVADFPTFATRFMATYTTSSVTKSYSGGRLKFKTNANMGNGVFSQTNYPFVSGVSYHIRFEESKEGGQPLSVGEQFDSGFIIYYTDGTSVPITTLYTGRLDEYGCPSALLEYRTDPNKQVKHITIRFTPEGATNILTDKQFLFVAEDGTSNVPAPMIRTLSCRFGTQLLSLNDWRDTFSLAGGITTSRIWTASAGMLISTVYDQTGTFTIYRLELEKRAAPYSPLLMRGYSNRSYENLKTNTKSCCMSEDGRYVYMTVTANEKTIEDLWMFMESSTPSLIYVLEEPDRITTEPMDLTAYEGFVAISMPEFKDAHLRATYYD